MVLLTVLLINLPKARFYGLSVLFTLSLLFCDSNRESTMIRQVLRAIIMGPPGAGKGTISERIIKDFPLKHLSSGDILRHNMARNTAVGKEAKQYIDAGRLVPDKTMVELVAAEMAALKDTGVLLDGFPRTVPQAEALSNQIPIDIVLNMDVPFEVIIERIKGRWLHPGSGRIYHTEFNPPKVPGMDDETGEALIQRDDDKEETVKARLRSYQQQTQPVLSYYRDHGLLEEFQGSYSNEIWPKVHKFLATKMKPLQFTQYGK